MKKHTITGDDVPDEAARVPLYRYVNPRKAEWPAADFIVGNPPFIGNWKMRQALGDGYSEALRKTYGEVPDSVDYVMYWWEKAAGLVRAGKVRRFGLITTKTIGQSFARPVLRRHLEGKPPLSIVFAIPNHPWVDTSACADVRIAMTVGEASDRDGRLVQVVDEHVTSTGEIEVDLSSDQGRIHADLKIGANVTSAVALKANAGVCSPGVKLHGAGFIVESSQASILGLGTVAGLERHVRAYRNGKDVTSRPRGVMVIDLFDLPESAVRERFPAVYQWVLERVKPERDQNNRKCYRERWWIFGEPRVELREALVGQARYIATVETATHRAFFFFGAEILPDNKLIAVASDDAYTLGVLSSRIHVAWALEAGGRLGVGDDPVYVKTTCFEKFPFPVANDPQKTRIRDLAEALDAHRKARLAEHPDLTITGLYNVLEKLRAGEPLTAKDKALHEAGLVSVLKSLHDDLDAAVFEAYGWPADLTDEQILERLVALNAERAKEEAGGLIRWLRPEYQAKGLQAPAATKEEQADLLPAPETAPAAVAGGPVLWPKALQERLAVVRTRVTSEARLWSVEDVRASFKGARGDQVEPILDSLAFLGHLVRVETADGARWQGAGRSA